LLVIGSVEKRLVDEVRKNDTLIIVGETGSGKTTRKFVSDPLPTFFLQLFGLEACGFPMLLIVSMDMLCSKCNCVGHRFVKLVLWIAGVCGFGNIWVQSTTELMERTIAKVK
jgi:hypothetical protein